MNKLKKIFRIVAKIPDKGLHVAYIADDNEFKATYLTISGLE